MRAGTRSRGERCRSRARETAGYTGRRQVKLSERNMGRNRENEVKKKRKGKRLSKRDRSRRECSAL